MIRALLAALALSMLVPVQAAAQAEVPIGGISADPDAPIEIAADMLEVDQAGGAAEFSGNVQVVQGDLRLAAARVRVEYTTPTEAAEAEGDEAPAPQRRRIARVVAEGGVTLVTATEAAEAAEAVYDLEAGTIRMQGDVVLAQGGSALAGDRLVIDLETRAGRIEGRVRSVILPDGGQ